MSESSATGPRIESLTLPVSERELGQLARLLVDAVDSGSAVSFLAPLTIEESVGWWRDNLANPSAAVLVARDGGSIVGTVQLTPAWAPNQPHRAEIGKLLVDRRIRRQGVATRLVRAVEELARREGFTLLTLDAKHGEPAEVLYRKLDWIVAGTIPRFALDPDGRTSHDAVIMYKELDRIVRTSDEPS